MNQHFRAASFLANLLDNTFEFGKFKFGLSAFINLIPGIGDIVDALLSLYIVWIALEMRVPNQVIVKMLGNILFYFLLGLIPVLGDAIYFIRKVNIKNVNLLKNYASRQIIEGQLVAS